MNMITKLLTITTILFLAAIPAFAGGGTDIPAPSITLDLPATSYISPGSVDDVQDELSFNVTITAGQNMVIKGYRVVVADQTGLEIYIDEQQYPGSQPFFEQFLINLGFANLKKPITVPETLTWDGEATDGSAVADGSYTIRVEGWDDREETGSTSGYSIVVDNTPPNAELVFPHTIFSPNADGNKDLLIVEQTGSDEKLWKGSIIDEHDTTVYVTAWADGAPSNLIWDGKTLANEIATDGTYTYVLAATDLAGNAFEIKNEQIVINTQDTPLSVTRNVASFSPNDDGSVDTIEFGFDVPVLEGIREWTLDILVVQGGASETTMRTISGDAAVPNGLIFNGKSSGSMVLPEGTYRARLSLLYENGNNPSATSSDFILDITPPSVSVKAHPVIFSPNGDGLKDTVQIYQETSAEETWIGRAYNASDDLILEQQWRGRADSTVTWNGRDADNSLVPDGEYRYVLSSRDRAGNYAETTSEPIVLDTRETSIAFSSDAAHYSPNADGVRDTLTLFPGILDTSGIEKLEVRVTDEAGETVKTFMNTTARSEIVWDGTNEANQPAPNGIYYVDLGVRYVHGNNPTARIGPIEIDRSVPTANLSASATIFSPDGDGKLDDVRVSQTESSAEDAWVGRFTNEAGVTVLSRQWTGNVDGFVWNGTDEEGNRLPDGHYRYTLSSTDKSGNRGLFVIERITIDTRETPVSLRIGSSSFSPNRDGIKDMLIIKPVLQVTDNIETWRLDVRDGVDAVVRSYSGVSHVPAAIEFDGKDESGARLPETSYTSHLTVLYRSGSNPSTISPPFSIDVTRPRAAVSAEPVLFSPNGDGIKDTTTFAQNGSVEETWRGWIANSQNESIRSFSWFGELAEKIAWDGKDDGGRSVPNGSYYFTLSSTDRAGNSWESDPVRVRLDSRRVTVALSIEPEYISPNNDDIQDSLRIIPAVSLNAEIDRHVVEVIDSRGAVVRRFEGSGRIPQRITWNGRTADGDTAADGRYNARIDIEYAKGDRPSAESTQFIIDATAPTAEIEADITLFSPDGDGQKDSILITQETSSEDLWEATIKTTSGRVVLSEFWKGTAEDFVWNGTDANGRRAADGVYRYELTATDRGGNGVFRRVHGIVLDTRATSAYVNPASRAISPNGDDVAEEVQLNLYASLNEGITDWSLVITDDRGTIVRDLTVGNSKSLPEHITWDGRNEDGEVIDGEYTPRLTVSYDKGNYVEAIGSNSVLIDVTGPAFEIAITPTPFSPDDDGISDKVSIGFAGVEDASSIAEWRLSILDPYGNTFREWNGTGTPPRSFVWDGYSEDDELVQAAEDYPVVAWVTDSMSNFGVREAVLPVDILVIREGDALKIRISSIQFAPNLADFIEFDEEKAARNLKTLSRLAEILQKYSSYQIRIEGHAVLVYWYNEARAKVEEEEELQPLSQARADAVKDALIDLGIPEARMTTIGMGGTQPIVPHGDTENRWKSRRVEFILIR